MTYPATCKICGEYEADCLGHNYQDKTLEGKIKALTKENAEIKQDRNDWRDKFTQYLKVEIRYCEEIKELKDKLRKAENIMCEDCGSVYWTETLQQGDSQ